MYVEAIVTCVRCEIDLNRSHNTFNPFLVEHSVPYIHRRKLSGMVENS